MSDQPQAGTLKQRALLQCLLQAHVFTDAERRHLPRGITTAQHMGRALNWTKRELQRRKDKQAAAFAQARDAPLG